MVGSIKGGEGRIGELFRTDATRSTGLDKV
jgi:hypothetical protein